MKELSLTKIAYYAGFLDGEGCIGLNWNITKKGNKCHTLYTEISNTNKEVIYILYNDFGMGSIRITKPKNKKHRMVYKWYIREKDSYEFLKLLLPYLIVKKKQAELAIYYIENKKNLRGFKSFYMDNNKVREEFIWRNDIDKKLKELKREVDE